MSKYTASHTSVVNKKSPELKCLITRYFITCTHRSHPHFYDDRSRTNFACYKLHENIIILTSLFYAMGYTNILMIMITEYVQ